ncbi:MAG: radical SAM protein [Patescibacteria group bacterium]
MIDCLLIYPNPTKDSPKKGVALGIFYCGAMLEKSGLSVEYFDSRFDSNEKLRKIIDRRVLCVGISSMTGNQLREAKEFLKFIKNEDASIFTIMGGVHPSILPLETLSDELVDFVVIGEGEFVLVDLIRQLKGDRRLSEVESLCWKDGRKLIKNKRAPFIDLKDLPSPLTKKTEKYYVISAKTNNLIHPTSRSCPGFCGFCYNTVVNKSQWRSMPVMKWAKEFNEMVNLARFSHMFTGDDNIGRDKERIKEIGDVFMARGVTWHTNIRPEYLDEELIGILERGGCTSLLLGYESGCNRILNTIIKKGLPNGVLDLRRCAELIGRSKINALYSFMSNLPTETWGELKESMDLADYIKKVDKKCRISFYVYGPYPGTPMYHMALRQGFREPRSIEEWGTICLTYAANALVENLHYIASLNFRGGKGDNTSINFPGLKRLLLLPFELSAKLRWKLRFFRLFNLEKRIVKYLFGWAAARIDRLHKYNI